MLRIYITCYFFPIILLIFIHDPLRTILTYSIVIFLIAIGWYCLFIIQAISELKLITKKSNILEITLFAMALCGFLVVIMFVLDAIDLGSLSDFHSLQATLLSLLVGLISFSVFRPAYRQVHKHTKLIKHTDVDKEETVIKSYDDEICTENEDNHLHDDTETEVMDNQNNKYTLV